MRPPEEEVIRKIVGEWMRKADQDIASAQALLSQDPPLLYPSCFHSQQAAEKYLKAYLTWRQVEFPKTHSIREILNLVKTVDEDLATNLLPAAVLTPYGVDVRGCVWAASGVGPSHVPEIEGNRSSRTRRKVLRATCSSPETAL